MQRFFKKIITIISIVFLFFSGLFQCNTAYAKPITDLQSPFWIKYIDVGQGDSALIQCDGHYMMIDGGPSSASSIVYTILKSENIKNLDYMIATHPDADHIGCLSGALNFSNVGACYSPVLSNDTKAFGSLIKYLNKKGSSLIVPAKGTSFSLGSAKVELLEPVSDYEDSNNSSVVAKVTYGSNRFLFTGDAEMEEESALIRGKNDLACDVLKVGHHGSKDSTGEAFLKKTKPKYAVISVGSDNSYGHPTTETLGRLSNAKVEIFRTDLQGDILCSSDGKNISFATEKKAADDVLWIPGLDSTATVTKDGVVVAAPEKAVIPDGTTFVLNTNTGKFHLPTCSSVNQMKASNRSYSTESAEAIVAAGYKPCGNCKPYSRGYTSTNTNGSSASQTGEKSQGSKQNDTNIEYVLNTNTKKFHYPYCSSVSDMSPKNRKDVNISRDEIILQGYVPCKRCNP